MANSNEKTAVTLIDSDWCSGVIGHSNETHHLSEEVERLRTENAELLESLRVMAHSGMGSGMDPLQVIANEVQAAIPTKQGQLLAAMLREGVTELRSHIVSAVESMHTHADRDAMPRVELLLRRLLAHRVSGAQGHYENGELRDNSKLPHIDFLREHPKDIDMKLIERDRMHLSTQGKCGEPQKEGGAPPQPEEQSHTHGVSDSNEWLGVLVNRALFTGECQSLAQWALVPTQRAALESFADRLLAAKLQEDPTDRQGNTASAVGSMPSTSEGQLRRLLAVRVAMPHTHYDDGEAHGSEHGVCIDFMRDSVEDLNAKLRALNVARANVPPMTDEDILKCVRSVGTPIPMGLIRDRGPYEVSEPTYFSRRFVEAIAARLRGQVN